MKNSSMKKDLSYHERNCTFSMPVLLIFNSKVTCITNIIEVAKMKHKTPNETRSVVITHTSSKTTN